MKLCTYIATLGPVGYLPAPGTMGSLATLPLVYAISSLFMLDQCIFILFFSIISYFAIKKALPYFVSHDPSHIILDEVIGCLVTFIGIDFSCQSLVVGFFLFRLFDILKPFGIKNIEKIGGAWGVILDDVIAGLFANIILRLLIV
ncbi:phosphatidylglycerophosphatase A family protein [Candidatus Chromulinivorax destructor]|nr:phosphatidylglycerophosphatase A [Candidatus Chromulinivorax destructor]